MGLMARPSPRMLLLLLFSLALPAAAAYGKGGKKSQFLAAYPMIFKFCLFWWCVFVFAVMGIYILDHLLFRFYGPAKVVWKVDHVFKGSADREAFWRQFVDPSQWSPKHPVLQSADIRMVECSAAEEQKEAQDDAKDDADADKVDPDEGLTRKLRPVGFGPMKPGLGMILRHKADAGARAGSFFCSRECILLEAPDDGPWRMVMRTLEAGPGYPFLANTEQTEVQMLPADKDGSVHCSMRGTAHLTSRFFRWWTKLQSQSVQGALAMLQAVEAEVSAPKKSD